MQMQIFKSSLFFSFVMANAGALLNKICANPGKKGFIESFSKSKRLNSDAFSDRNYRDNIPFFDLFAADFFGVVELEVFSRVDWLSRSHFYTSFFGLFFRFFEKSLAFYSILNLSFSLLEVFWVGEIF